MNFSKSSLAAILSILFVFNVASAQTGGMTKKSASTAAVAGAKTETFKVLGNCGMCKKTIEKAALKAGAASANWDTEKGEITVSFDTEKTSADAIQKSIAQSGYDNAGYKAPEDAYKNLHGCCKYDRTGAAGGSKSCEKG